MGPGSYEPLLGVIDKALDKKTYQELHWEGSFEDYLKIVGAAREPSATLPARLRHDPVVRLRAYRQPGSPGPLQFFKDPWRREGLHLRPRRLPLALVTPSSPPPRLGTERRIFLLHGRSAARSRPSPAHQKGPRSLFAHPGGLLYTFAGSSAQLGRVPHARGPCGAAHRGPRPDPRRSTAPRRRLPLKIEANSAPPAAATSRPHGRREGRLARVLKAVKSAGLILSEKDRVASAPSSRG